MLQPGHVAPTFSLPDSDMRTVDLASFKGHKNVVLYFYPRDGTPGCVLQAADFSDHEEQFSKHHCIVFGVSRDDCLRHAEFRDAHGLSVNLLSDTEGEVCRLYGVLHESEQHGVRRENLIRSTFVIDKHGVIRHAAYNVNPKGHAAQVFDVVRKLKS